MTLDYWKGRDKAYASELTDEIRANAAKTIALVLDLLAEYGTELPVTSGWRPSAINKAAGGARKSKHMTGQACDLADPKGDFGRWCLANVDVLERLGLWAEHPDYTETWVHVQTIPPASGRRFYRP